MKLDLRDYAPGCHLLDGAWGTELERQGLLSGKVPELLNAENPAAIEAVARSYVEAGSEIILTNTFGANRFILERHGASERVEELATAGVNISREAADGHARVFASIGPTGKIVMMGEVSTERLSGAFRETAAAIDKAGPDGIVLETFNELAELTLALQAVKTVSELPVVACMTFSAGEDGTASIMGNTLEELAAAGDEYGAAAVGANCGIGPDVYLKVARRLRAATTLPIWIKPNAGVPELAPDGKTRYPVGSEDFAAYVPQFVEAGVTFIGGCCGSTPAHIKAMRNAMFKRPVERRGQKR